MAAVAIQKLCKISSIEKLNADAVSIWLEAGELARAAQVGQFVNIKCGKGLLLRRPISICRAEGTRLNIVFEVRGEGTAWLAQRTVGEKLDVLGPLGHGFTYPDGKVLVVGGGIGTAPMFQLTRELAAAGVKPDVFFGFRDAPYCMEDYRPIANLVKVSTDTGAVGFHGFVTQLYDPADYDVVLVCGPTVMMRNAARLCAEKGTPCLVSMEKKMACGIGACLGCTCETKSGEGKSVCKNGPVFDATEVFF